MGLLWSYLGYDPALFAASEKGDLAQVKSLLERGYDVNEARSKDGAGALFVASVKNHLDIVDALIAAGADVNAARKVDDGTPLYWASGIGNLQVVERLVAAGAIVDHDVGKAKGTALCAGAQSGKADVCRHLLEHGADVNFTRGDGATPVLLAAQNGRGLAVLDAFVDVGGLDLESVDPNKNPLLTAAQGGFVGFVEALLARGMSAKLADARGRTALHLAATRGHSKLCTILLDAGANVNAATTDGRNVTPLFLSLNADHEHVAAVLLQAGADHTGVTNGQTPLHMCCERGYNTLLESLIENGVALDVVDAEDRTALFVAAVHGHADVVEQLLDAEGVFVDDLCLDKVMAVPATKEELEAKATADLAAGGEAGPKPEPVMLTARGAAELRGHATVVALFDKHSTQL